MPRYDLHATILHLMGIDREKLRVRHDGTDCRLTDIHGHEIKAVLAEEAGPNSLSETQ